MEIANGAIGMHALRQMFETFSFAMSMAEVAHLSSWKGYYLKFLSLMTHRYDADTGFWGPTILEAQAADKALMNVAIDLVTERSWSWDDALYEITHIRADMTSLLQPRPKLPKAAAVTRVDTFSGKGNSQSSRPALTTKARENRANPRANPKCSGLQRLQSRANASSCACVFRLENALWVINVSSIMVVLTRWGMALAARRMEH